MSSLEQLQAREAELRRLNEQLERRKATVVRQTEEAVLRREARRAGTPDVAAASEAEAETACGGGGGGHNAGGMAQPSGAGGGDDDEVAEGLGSEATVRYQRAKIRVMAQELEQLSSAHQDVCRELAEEQQQRKQAVEALAVQQRRAKAQDVEVEKQRKRAELAGRKLEDVSLELAAVKKELEVALRSRQTERGDASSKDVRLNRALQELEKFKGLLQERRAAEREQQSDARGELERLTRDHRKLEKHKAELVAAFRKQTKLIDVLRRQKLHVEAARMLSFTEAEYTAALEG
jgi:hypothetical protein